MQSTSSLPSGQTRKGYSRPGQASARTIFLPGKQDLPKTQTPSAALLPGKQAHRPLSSRASKHRDFSRASKRTVHLPPGQTRLPPQDSLPGQASAQASFLQGKQDVHARDASSRASKTPHAHRRPSRSHPFLRRIGPLPACLPGKRRGCPLRTEKPEKARQVGVGL